jgi:hypothetical protein
MKNVRVFNIAISDKVGTADFFHIPNRTGLDSLMQYADAEHATAERKSVETISLDEFVKRENIPHVDAMKIDVEGAEPLVFAGMKQVLLQKPFVVFEYSAKYSHALVADLLKSHQLFSIPRTGKLTPIVGEPDEDCNNIVIADA